MLQAITSKWWVLLLRGLAAIVVGGLMLENPGLGVFMIVTYYAISVLFDGVAAVMLGFGGNEKGGIWWEMILLGLLSAVAGVVMLLRPGLTEIVLLAIVAGWAIARGVLEIAAAIRLRKAIEGEWIMILDGVISIVFGLLVIRQPGSAILVITILIAIMLIVTGLVSILLSLELRSLKNRVKSA